MYKYRIPHLSHGQKQKMSIKEAKAKISWQHLYKSHTHRDIFAIAKGTNTGLLN